MNIDRSLPTLGAVVVALSLYWSSNTLQAEVPTGGPPELMSYQGYLADANGAGLAAGKPANYDMIFRFYTAATGGTRVWSERQTVTVDKGYFSVLLGQGLPVSPETNTATFSGVFSGTTASGRYISITVVGQGTGNADLLIEPRVRLLPTAYSFVAGTALALSNAKGEVVVTVGTTKVELPNTGSTFVVNGVVTGSRFAGDGSTLTGLTSAQIPNLNASKITAGTLASSTIPDLSADKIASGKLDAARIPGISGDLIVSGNIADVRLTTNVALKDSGPNFSAGLYLRDSNNGLRYDSNFGATTDINGPVLFGESGGKLGYTDVGERVAAEWNSKGFSVIGQSAEAVSGEATSTTYGTALKQFSIYGRSTYADNVRLAMGTGIAVSQSYFSVIQSYSSLNGTAPLRLNPLGGSVIANVTAPSDRNVKTNFQAVDSREILAKVALLPVTTWAYTNEATIVHMGPVAQDFKAAFNLGVDDKGISSVDMQGVTLSAIQGLHAVLQEKDGEIKELKRELQELRSLVEGLAKATK